MKRLLKLSTIIFLAIILIFSNPQSVSAQNNREGCTKNSTALECYQEALSVVSSIKQELQTKLEELETLGNKVDSLEQKLDNKVQNLSNKLQDLTNIAVVQDSDSVNNIHLFLADEYVNLWRPQDGGDHNIDVSEYIPDIAKGAVIKVIVNSRDVGSASFVCADRKGNYSKKVDHYLQNGYTNYSKDPFWSGGIVFCPFFEKKTFRWKMVSNQNDPDSNVVSYGGLIGWF
ncbi:MAG: hypothetical protein F6K40_19365 [Okeania sp. SIO3I5]|uniref:hypothetical protein n=1 Tax=Okeania sp. SIO3I5 TaxID=2607805 RepID=UPI0013BA34E9|nr:hypothetical protein [Okeania sp. SIO3I5]NEQ38304.1 hypothetical protein [Okeania sp. SIO3I5]